MWAIYSHTPDTAQRRDIIRLLAALGAPNEAERGEK
jgi:hypothetical protein